MKSLRAILISSIKKLLSLDKTSFADNARMFLEVQVDFLESEMRLIDTLIELDPYLFKQLPSQEEEWRMSYALDVVRTHERMYEIIMMNRTEYERHASSEHVQRYIAAHARLDEYIKRLDPDWPVLA
jgi:hypothetical protein